MKLNKTKPKTELESVRDLCKAQGFDYDRTRLIAECDTMGNIISIETDDKKLQSILKSKGFT